MKGHTPCQVDFRLEVSGCPNMLCLRGPDRSQWIGFCERLLWWDTFNFWIMKTLMLRFSGSCCSYGRPRSSFYFLASASTEGTCGHLRDEPEDRANQSHHWSIAVLKQSWDLPLLQPMNTSKLLPSVTLGTARSFFCAPNRPNKLSLLGSLCFTVLLILQGHKRWMWLNAYSSHIGKWQSLLK